MNRKPVLEALRQRIAARERHAPALRPAAPLSPAGDLPMLETGALHEFLPAAPGDFAAALGFTFAAAARIAQVRPGALIWAYPAHQAFREGRVYPLGLTATGLDPDRLIEVRAAKARNILWALEEALGYAGLAAAIGLLPEKARTYDFTASRRLALRAAEHGVTALVLWPHAQAGVATAAATRWSVAAEPSAPRSYIGQARPGLGIPRWKVALAKSKKGVSGQWRVEWDHETFSFRLSAPLADRTPPWADHPVAGHGWAAAS
jgi:protein ImuA